ncbi:hypothetical protein F511_43946 [Dorcoceras hygrometricum]|uniref:Uncharacterized protein n=1 Tax=Dorcoceras hygrometricum TaxID=472368 RepID=A0A2Z7C2Z9_9LAMI|nr:hypothetical protein F511_43946 [Dorcoceras hygrometricum]
MHASHGLRSLAVKASLGRRELAARLPCGRCMHDMARIARPLRAPVAADVALVTDNVHYPPCGHRNISPDLCELVHHRKLTRRNFIRLHNPGKTSRDHLKEEHFPVCESTLERVSKHFKLSHDSLNSYDKLIRFELEQIWDESALSRYAWRSYRVLYKSLEQIWRVRVLLRDLFRCECWSSLNDRVQK